MLRFVAPAGSRSNASRSGRRRPARSWSGRDGPGSAAGPSSSPTVGARRDPRARRDHPLVGRARSGTRSPTATAASARSTGRAPTEPGEGSTVFAFHPHQDLFTAPAADVVAVEGVDGRVATLFPLVETALQVSLDAGPRVEEPVVVLGLGPVGVLTAAMLQRSGADVLGADPRGDRRETAARFGIRVVDASEIREAVAASTSGAGVPLVVDASGSPAALPLALELLAHEGEALVCSWFGSKDVRLPLGGAFHRRRLTIRSTQVSTIPARLAGRWDIARRRQAAMRLMTELPVKLLATHELPVRAGGRRVRRARPRRRERHARRVEVLMFEVGASTSFRAFHRMPDHPPPENERHPRLPRRGGGRAGASRRTRHGLRPRRPHGCARRGGGSRPRSRPVGDVRGRGRHGRGPRGVDPRAPRRSACAATGPRWCRSASGSPRTRSEASVRASDVGTRRDVVRLSLVTLGDPERRTGGYRYHRMMAAAAADHRASVRFERLPALAWPLPALAGARALRAAAEGPMRSCSTASRRRSPRRGSPGCGPRSSRWSISHRVACTAGERAGSRSGGSTASRTARRPGSSSRRRASSTTCAASACRPTGSSSCRRGATSPSRAARTLDLRRGRAVSVLCVANWTPHKGILELLDAFATLPEEAATLWLVGATDADARYAGRVRRRVAAPDLRDRVVVRGSVPVEEVGRFYRWADVFALCSFVDAYGTAWAEAIAAGLPVVGWRAGNLPRLAEHGREALMAEPGDLAGLAAALRAIVTDDVLRARLAAGARRLRRRHCRRGATRHSCSSRRSASSCHDHLARGAVRLRRDALGFGDGRVRCVPPAVPGARARADALGYVVGRDRHAGRIRPVRVVEPTRGRWTRRRGRPRPDRGSGSRRPRARSRCARASRRSCVSSTTPASSALVSSDRTEWLVTNLERLGRPDGWAAMVCADGDAARASRTHICTRRRSEAPRRAGGRDLRDRGLAERDPCREAAGIPCLCIPERPRPPSSTSRGRTSWFRRSRDCPSTTCGTR